MLVDSHFFVENCEGHHHHHHHHHPHRHRHRHHHHHHHPHRHRHRHHLHFTRISFMNMDVETREISARHVNASQWLHPYLGRSLDPFLTRVEHGCTPVIADQLMNSDDMWVKCGVPSSLPASDVFFALAKTHHLFTDEQFKPSWIPWAPSCFIWGFPYKQGTPFAGWSVMDHPMENMDDLEVPGTPILGNLHIFPNIRTSTFVLQVEGLMRLHPASEAASNLCCVGTNREFSWAKSLRFRIFRCFICNFSCKSHDFS